MIPPSSPDLSCHGAALRCRHREFARLIERILVAARAGQTVVIHCRGGLGRSGTVAAACLVALGHQPADAIELVRSARPGAVESTSQERWVHSYSEARTPQR